MKKEFDIIDLDFTDALPVVKEEDTKEKYYSTEETISEENYEAEENTAGANVNANAEELTINEEAAGAEVFQGEVSVDTIIMSGIADAVEGITKENSNGYNGAVIYDKESTDKIREEIELALESGELPAEEAAAFAAEGGAMQTKAVLAPMLIAAVGIVLSIIGIFAVRTKENADMKSLIGAFSRGTNLSSLLIVVATFGILYLLDITKEYRQIRKNVKFKDSKARKVYPFFLNIIFILLKKS